MKLILSVENQGQSEAVSLSLSWQEFCTESLNGEKEEYKCTYECDHHHQSIFKMIHNKLLGSSSSTFGFKMCEIFMITGQGQIQNSCLPMYTFNHLNF